MLRHLRQVSIWVQVALCFLAWHLAHVRGSSGELRQGIEENIATQEILISGSLAIGQFSYTLSGRAVPVAGGLEYFELVIRTGQAQVAAIRIDTRLAGGPMLDCGGDTRALPTNFSSSWANLFSLTSKDLDARLGFVLQPGEGTRTWETTSPISIRSGLPVKIRFVFCEGAHPSGSNGECLTDVVVWSLVEWNNSFDENVVLRLRLIRGERHE